MAAACSPAAPEPEAKPDAAVAGPAPPCKRHFKEGENEILAVHCKGKATAQVNVAGKDYSLAGGDCELNPGRRTLYIGAQSSDTTTGPLPNCVST